MARSRIRRHLQEQSKRNIVLAIVGIIVVIFLIFSYGMDFLINFSLLVKRSTTSKDVKQNEVTYVAPPVIDPLSEATKSARITVSGYAGDKQTIKLYLNGKLTDKTEVNKNKQFSFSDVKLEKGSNEVKAKAVTPEDKESDYSQISSITYSDEPPKLEINSPQDGQTVSKGDGLKISGKTDPNVKVTVNDFWAIVQDDGNFSYTLPLHDGENTIKIVATDDADNQTTKELKVKTD
jgi:hypothetical protein